MEKISVSDLSVGDWVCAEQLCGVHSKPRLTPPMKVVGLGDGAGGWVNLMIDPEQGDPFEFEPSEIRGVPITAEVLEKNGWQPPRKDVDLDTWWWTNGVDKAIEAYEYEGEWYLTIIEQKEIQYRNRVGIGLKHIHELQHELRLAKVGKEIVL